MPLSSHELLERARALRNEPTPFEVILWRHLSRFQLGGFKFRRQAVIGSFICDFLCPAKGLVIEVDGDTHDARRDAERDAQLRLSGFDTLRFTNREVGGNIEGVLQVIREKLQSLPDRWADAVVPTPTPPLKGRGFS